MRVGLYSICIELCIAALVCILMSGCVRTNYVPVKSVRTEYRDREVEKLITDTVRDTQLMWLKGDTVVIFREKEKTKSIEIRDTCYVEQVDTIRVPYPVERSLTRWQQAKVDFGGVAMALLILPICIAVGWLAAKFRR